MSAIIQTLIRIVINTVDAQHHRCKKSHEEGFIPPSPTILRSRGRIYVPLYLFVYYAMVELLTFRVFINKNYVLKEF